MERRSISIVTAGLVLATASLALASERNERRALRAALERAEPSGLERSLPALERVDAARRREFAIVGAKRLPAKSADRLRRTKEAYEAGHGRLIGLLRTLSTGAAAAGGPGRERGALMRETLALLRRLEDASAGEPISQAAPRIKAPDITAPTLASDTTTPTITGSEDDAPIGSIPGTLKEAAAGLAGPVEVYEWVRNNIRPELYHGAMKGALQTYLEGSGNDADTAAVLVDMLRAKGIPARFVRGTAELTAATLTALTGTANVSQAVRTLARAGIPHEAIQGGGSIGSVRMERTWVEAYVPYANYRGAILDRHGKVWIPLDAGFKRLEPPRGHDIVRELGFDPRATLDAYLGEAQTDTGLEFVRRRVSELAAPHGLDYASLLNRRGHLAENLGVLPSTLPFPVRSVTEIAYDVPQPLRHTLHLVGETSDGAIALDATLPLRDAIGRRLTLAYVPFSAEDEEVARHFGGLLQTPPYLVEVRPVLRSGGVDVAVGEGAIGFGVRYTLRLELATPGGVQTVTNRVIAGDMIALGLGGRTITREEESTRTAAGLLSALALQYFHRWNESDEELSNLLRVVPVRPTVSLCLVTSDVEVDYAGGDPAYPLTHEWKGLLVDADLRATSPVGVDSPASERSFAILSGLEGSVLEARIFADGLKIAAVSTASALGLASNQGIPIHDLTADNVEAVLPGLALEASVKDEILAAAHRGLLVRVPAAEVTRLAWTGVGYLLLDENTGEAAYQLQGGHSGGVTAPAVIDLPAEIVDLLLSQDEDIPPAPEGADVAQVQKFVSTDLQEGTVDRPLERPFKVLVTDVDGQPVPNAPVAFTVIGGEGKLLDPLRGLPVTGDLTVYSNERGEAEARLQLGQSTGLIPRYFRGEDEEHSTRVGLNLVTARSGGATLDEAFTGIAFPDYRRDPVTGLVTVKLAPRGDQGYAAPGNLRVAGLYVLDVTDQFDNPISNKEIRFSYAPPLELLVPPPGWTLARGLTDTAGHVLKPSDYLRCAASSPIVFWGECPGEALEVLVQSSAIGAYVYYALGDSPATVYTFHFGTVLNPDLGWFKAATDGWMCKGPCPQPVSSIVEMGPRSTVHNSLGNMVEAYPLGSQAPLRVWVDQLSEIESIQRFDGPSGPYYRAVGTNAYRRQRLDRSQIVAAATTPGTGASASLPHAGNGNYDGVMTMASGPQLNTIELRGTHVPWTIPYLANGIDVDPAYVTSAGGTYVVERIRDNARPRQGTLSFSLWGILPTLTGVEPSPLLTTPAGTVARPATVSQAIAPPAFKALLSPADVLFELRQGDQQRLAANGLGDFTIPTGLAVTPGIYTGQLSVIGVSAVEPLNIASPAVEISACPLLTLDSRVIVMKVTRDPLNDVVCGAPENISFTLCGAARVNITVDGTPLQASVDGNAPATITDLPLGQGPHVVTLPAGFFGVEIDGRHSFEVRAVYVPDPTVEDAADGEIITALANRAALPVGRTFVKGVDLFDGHLVQQATDIRQPGRHLGLEVTRTYSSAGRSHEGAMGAGWSWTHDSTLQRLDCGLVAVGTADGGSQTFRSLDGGLTYTPQKGYHTRLVKNQDGSFDFFSKSGVRHRFGALLDASLPEGPRRLDYIEEPHGDRLVLTYLGREVVKVAEVQRDRGEVRRLDVSYVSRGGHKRISKVEAVSAEGSLNLHMDYEYDEFGNLRRAVRDGGNLDGAAAAAPREYRYEYTVGDGRDRHQLIVAIDPRGNPTRYQYHARDIPFPGESGARIVADREQYVRYVIEKPVGELRTEFQYDVSEAGDSRFLARVLNARQNRTTYVLDGNGSPLEIREPRGRTTKMEWATDDIFKTSERDALDRETRYDYDGQGNLILERILTADLGAVETRYAYDSQFGKLTFKKDAEGFETRYALTAAGDLETVTDAVGNVTEYRYDDFGQLTAVISPRGRADANGFTTVHAEHESFGNPLRITDPLGHRTDREYDIRGRLVREADSFGRETRYEYDGLDRPVKVTRRAGVWGDNRDEVSETTYYPSGEVQSVTNANGGTTSFVLDGLGRVTETSIRVAGEVLTTEMTYDGNGNKETEKDRRGVRRRFQHDELDRLRRVEITSGMQGEGPVGAIAEYDYDLAGNRLRETDLTANLTTDFEYDGLYQLRARVLPESGASGPYREVYVHDRVGNRLKLVDPNLHATEWEYDGLRRVISTKNGAGHRVTFRFDDPEGSHVNKSEEFDETRGLQTTFRYDPIDREIERRVVLEGLARIGRPEETQLTTTDYLDADHSMTVRDPRRVATRVRLDGLDRVVERVADDGGLNLSTQTSFDGLGNPVRVTDPRQHATTSLYDEVGRLTERIDALERRTSFEYFGDGLKRSETDRRQVRRDFTYDNLGRLRRMATVPSISGVAWGQETQYDDAGRRRVEIDARQKSTVFHLDGLGRVVRRVDPELRAVVSTWDGVNKIAETDKRQHTTRFEYDEINRLRTVTDPEPFQGQTVVTTYEDSLNRQAVKDRRDISTVTQSDPLGRVLSVSRAGVTLEENRYDENGNLLSKKDAEGRETAYTYDNANRPASRIDGFGSSEAALTELRYDANGNLIEELDARARDLSLPFSRKNAYDELDRLASEIDGGSHTTAYGYDEEGNRTLVREPEGQSTTFAYDELGKLRRVTQPGNRITSYDYDPARNRIRQTDANQHVVEMTYDDLGRLLAMTQDPGGLGLVTSHAYDENGNERLLTDAKGQTVTSTYDELNRLKTKAYAFAAGDTYRSWRHTTAIAYTYDANSNLTQIDESVASGTDPPVPPVTLTTTRVYDDFDRLLSETSPLPDGGSRSVGNTYFANGTRKTVTEPSGAITVYTYDGRNRLATATTAAGTPQAVTTTYDYFPDDLLKTVTYPNAVEATHAYGNADRLASIANRHGTTVVSSYAYTYDGNGNRLTQVEANGGSTETTTYTYDDLNRLATVAYPADAVFPAGRKVTYGYDGVGNRTAEVTSNPATAAVLASKTGTFDNVNRLLLLTDDVAPAQTTSFAWDRNGNQTGKTVGGTTTAYRYDVRDRMVETVQGENILGRFQYDFGGRRSKKIGADGVVQYVYDQTSVLAEYDELGAQKARYDYGSDRLISMDRAGEGRRWYSLDGLRSVVNLTDDSGSTVTSYHLDAWGNFRFPSELTASKNGFAFTGYEWDPELGLFNAKARYFDPQIGRFTSQDSFLGEINDPPSLHQYFYANANPVRYIDTTGHAGQEANPSVSTKAFVYAYRGFQVARGASEAFGSNFLMLPRTESRDADFRVGQRAADLLSIPIGAYEASTGAGIALGGAAITVLSGGTVAPASVPAVGVGLAMVGHGALGATRAAEHLSKNVAEDESGGGSSKAQVRKEAPSGDAAVPEPRQKAESGAKPTMEPAAADAGPPADAAAARREARARQLEKNVKQGDDFEQEVLTKLHETRDDVMEQVSIRPNTAEGPARFRVRPDAVSREKGAGTVAVDDAKSSATAPLTRRQREGYPLIEQHGGTVVGEAGGKRYPAGTKIPPTKVKVVRPDDPTPR